MRCADWCSLGLDWTTHDLIDHLRAVDIAMLLAKLKQDGPSRWLMRKLQRYSVNVSEWHFRQLQNDHQIEEIWPGIWAQVEGTTIYHPVLGLILDAAVPSAGDLVI